SFRVPRPHQSERLGTPNACNDCHTDRSASWAGEAVDEWYGEERPPHFTGTLLKADVEGPAAYTELRELIADTAQPDIIRATAVWYVGQFPALQSADILEEALTYESPIIRSSAAKAMENLPSEMRQRPLEKVLEDPVRAVRLSAIRGLSEFSVTDISPPEQDDFSQALKDYQAYLDVNQYFPQGLMNRGQFFEQQGQTEQAIKAYRRALERDPYFNPARMNLAYLYNSRGENDRAEELLREVTEQEPEFGQAYYSRGLLLAEEDRLQEAVTRFEEAAERMPDHSRVFYNLAIARQTLGRQQEAETAYHEALELEPQNGDYRYGIVTLYMQQELYELALQHARVLDSLHPDNPQIQQLIQNIERQVN
ncbi:MAG: tetratricopeptide repeat protein, partial [Balneolaceae bacterium]